VRDPRPDTPTDEIGLRDQTRDIPSPSSWSVTSLDIFWPILAAVLVSAVVLVASVAHSSMDSVGVAASESQALVPKPAGKTGPILIVQISSHTTRAAASAASRELINRGIAVRVLKSDSFRPLNRGYFVVYAGPFLTTAAGRAEAKRIQDRIPGALLRYIHARADTTNPAATP
jgi:hypothetical protein